MPASDKHDEAVEESFPASDPPASSGITGERRDERKDRHPDPESRGDEAQPKGTPTSERHGTETAHQAEDQERPT
jgi:hypothetical protein